MATMTSVQDATQEALDRPARSVLRDVFGVHGVNSRGRRTRSLRTQLARIRTQPHVRVACVTIRPPGSSGADYHHLQRDLDSATDTYLQRCDVWIYCTAAEVVTTDILGANGMLDQDDCNAGWLLDFIGIGDHDVSHEEDQLFDLGRDLGADVVCYFLPNASTTSGRGGCAAHPDGRRGFWVGFNQSRWMFSHELGHVVGNNGHDDSRTNLMWDTPHEITVTPPVINQGQCADIHQDRDVESPPELRPGVPPGDGDRGPDDPGGGRRRNVVERALTATCGSPLVEERARTDETRAELTRIVRDAATPADRRARAVNLLAHWPDEETASVVAEIAPDLDERGRIAAASVLRRIDSSTAVDTLVDLADRDPSANVRRVAINGLGRRDDDDAHQALASAAADDPSAPNRRRATELRRH